MEITGKIYSRGMRALRDNWPAAFLYARMRFSRKLLDEHYGVLPFWTIKRQVIAAFRAIDPREFSIDSIDPRAKLIIVDLDMRLWKRDKVINKVRDEEGRAASISVKRTVSVRLRKATVEIEAGNNRSGVTFPVDFSGDFVKYGFRNEKSS